ncbi:hypothetical protein D3C79_1075950 [compost metagenome]
MPGEGFVELYADGFLADLKQLATKLLAAAVEQLHGVANGHAQDSADVMGLGFRQVVGAEAQGGVDEEAGQSHVLTL